MATNPSEVAGGGAVSRDAALSAMMEAGEGETPELDFDNAEEGEGRARDEQGRFASEDEPDPDGGEEELEELEADAEDEGEEIEDEDDEDDPLVSVKIDGEEQEIKLSELRNGYQRQADYTRKTQELSQQRQEVNHQINNLGQQAVAYAESYLEIAGVIESLAPSEQEVTEAWGYDPQEAARMKQRREEVLQQAQHAKQLAVAKYRDMQNRTRQLMAQAGQKLPEVVPEWADEKRRQEEIPSVAKYLVSQGLDPRAVETTADPNAWKIARKAWLYDQLQEKAAGKRHQPKAERIRKGNSQRPRLKGQQKQIRQSLERARETGSRQDVVSLLSQFEQE